MASRPVEFIVIGAGGRGRVYSDCAAVCPQPGRVVGVAEPRDEQRISFARRFQVPPANVASDWRELVERPKFADAALIATPDKLHVEPALAFLAKGYHLLLEKPMAPTEADCRRIAAAAIKSGRIMAVCHVLRYTDYTRIVKGLLDAGAVGDVVSVQHLEPVGYWHQAHSFVRGNWRNAAESSPMLLAKSCHDLDWLRYMIGRRCLKVSSFGSLKHFRKEEAPAGAGKRCLDCAVEPACPYSAKKIYLVPVASGKTTWPVDTVAHEPTVEKIAHALRTGPYGRCVYDCDNDVVDNQVVNMLFEGGRTASFTMTAFTEKAPRKTRIFGTRGCLDGDGRKAHHYDFLTEKWTTHEVTRRTGVGAGHSGGDLGMMSAFLAAVATNDPAQVITGPAESLETHLMVFAAEQARLENRVVEVRMQAGT